MIFIPISLDLQESIKKIILESKSNVSALTFANLYLFRLKYGFEVNVSEKTVVVSGKNDHKSFFAVLGEIPENIEELQKSHDYWKNTIQGCPDRDNFEYLYLKKDLAELPGKNFQKKRNLVNAFLKSYSNIEQKEIDKNTIKDAMQILEKWAEEKNILGDFDSAKEALELHEILDFHGLIFYSESTPIGYCQGEFLADGKSFAVHFEKAIDKYKGVYQYINQTFAKTLPEDIIYINREQDLGDEGLRQAKMTYRPIDFVKINRQ
jgi:hypothetical protein